MLFFRRDRSTLLRPKMHVIYTKLNPGDKTIPTQSTATKCQHTHTHKHSERATMCNGLVEKHYKIEAECGDSDLTLVTASIPELGFHIFTLSP